MSDEHERVQETLAGMALHALDADEMAEARALLAAHLPTCAECSRARDEFSSLVAELALAAPPRRPPRTLGTRLRREVRHEGRRLRVPLVAAAVAVAVVAGLGAWNAHLSSRVSRAEQRQAATQADTVELINAVSHPESRVVPMTADGTRPGAQVAATYVPGRALLYVFGSLPPPPRGHVYQVWVGRSGVFSSAGTFVPADAGTVLVRLSIDPSTYDTVLVTEEPAHGSSAPSQSQVATASL
ncbi:MAG TPA: anti-sigma factor [Actinomycetota bacterium]